MTRRTAHSGLHSLRRRNALPAPIVDRLVSVRWLMVRKYLRLPPHMEGDGREQLLVTYVLERTRRGDIDAVIEAFDEFAWRRRRLMSLGDEKGLILDRAVTRAAPSRLLELGTYCGYSALRTVRSMPADARLWCIEAHEPHARIAEQIFEHAGVRDRVILLVGKLGDDGATLAVLREDHGFTPGSVDFVFMDHIKSAYLADLQLLLSENLLHSGSVVVADNVRIPGAPDYLTYLRGQDDIDWRTVEHRTHLEYHSWLRDLMTESVFVEPRP